MKSRDPKWLRHLKQFGYNRKGSPGRNRMALLLREAYRRKGRRRA